MHFRPRTAIIYLCWNNLRHLPEVVASWEKLDYPKDRMTIVILPAHSPDGVADVIRRDVLPRSGKDLPEIVVIDEENRGFTVNNNVGLRWALEQGYDYVYLQNGDLQLDVAAISEAVKIGEADEKIGAVQSLVCFWNDHEKVNTSGGMVHVAGYGFARDNGKRLADVSIVDGSEIAYASGAAVLYRVDALKKVGLFDEGFFMYHDDLELGLRLKIAGYKNVIATQSKTYHDYQFGRTTKMFLWIEMNRYIVLLAYLRLRTILFLAPLWFAIEIGGWFMFVRSGNIFVKLRAVRLWLSPKPWRLIASMRRRAQSLRTISDRELTKLWTGKIEAQEMPNIFLERIANPVVDGIWQVLKKCLVW